MLPEDERVDELLNAYVDDAVSDSEREQAEGMLAEDNAAQARVDSLHEVQGKLRTHFAVSKLSKTHASHGPGPSHPRGLGSDFAERVIAAAQEEVRRQGASDHFVLGNKPEGKVEAVEHQQVNAPASGTYIWVVALGVAAALLLIFSLPALLAPSDSNLAEDEDKVDPTPGTQLAQDPDTQETLPQNPFRGHDTEQLDPAAKTDIVYVSEMEFPAIFLVMLVDIEVSDHAHKNDLLSRVFKQSGIDLDEPIKGDAKVKKAISEARMLVNKDEGDWEDASILFVRAPAADLSRALDAISVNKEDFPRIGFGLGYDTAQKQLLKSVAECTGKRFSVSQKFAAPVSVNIAGQVSTTVPFSQPKYVSNEQRELGFGDMQMLQSPPAGDEYRELSNALIFIRRK